MAVEVITNAAPTTLNGSINSTTTTIVVTSSSGFPSSGNFRIIIDAEIMLVTAVSGNTWTVVRGYESGAGSHADASQVTHVQTVGALHQLIFDRIPLSHNHLDNGSFGIALRQVPGTFTTPHYGNTAASAGGIDGYGADRWKSGFENAGFNYKRVDTVGAQEAGITERFYGQHKKITSTGKFFVYQPMEGSYTYALNGMPVTFQIKMKASSSKTIRLGLVQLNSSGTMDAIPALIVPTTWGSNSTDPTLGSNLAYITPDAVPNGGNTTISGSAASCSVTTAWQQFAVTFTVPSGAKNLLPCFWTDSQFAANDILSTTEATLTVGTTVAPYLPLPPQQALDRCQRYCKGWGNEGVQYERIGHGFFTTTTAGQVVTFPAVTMFKAPDIGYSALADLAIYDGVAVLSLSTLTADSGNCSKTPMYDFTITGGTSAANRPCYFLTQSTSGLFWFDADL